MSTRDVEPCPLPVEDPCPLPVEDPWIHRAMGMRCSTCIWFVKKEPAPMIAQHPGQHEIGRCRRHAPTVGGYPVVYKSDWCGDHRLDENKV